MNTGIKYTSVGGKIQRVDFQSTEGVGSRFKVELPLACAKNGKLELNNAN